MSSQQKTMLEKLELASPYNVFYNTIPGVTEQEDTITFRDLLCPSLGKLKCSLQIAFKMDIQWVMQQYISRDLGSKPLTVLYGEEIDEMEQYIKEKLPNVTHHCVGVHDLYASHHVRMGVYVYEDNSLRVVVSTANLNQKQWEQFNHGVWVSPLCPHNPTKTGESPTNFKSDLLRYLGRYKLPLLKQWIDYIKDADFSDVKVCLVTSVPPNLESHLQKMETLIKKHTTLTTEEESTWPIVIQPSSIGTYGPVPDRWVKPMLLKSLAVRYTSVPWNIIYPTVDNVKSGQFGEKSGEFLKYLETNHNNQRWLKTYLCQWKADKLGRTKIMPHTKIFCRVSPCHSKMAWFLLTSANPGKGAWGNKRRPYESAIVRNYEMGVLFIPKFFGEEHFPLQNGGTKKAFPLIFDLPLKKYESRDQPWTIPEMPESTQRCLQSFDALRLY